MASIFSTEFNGSIEEFSTSANNLSGKLVIVEDELYDVPVGIVVLLSIFYGTISLLAVFGNSLVIWIISTTKSMQTVTNLFIANLALADVAIGVFSIPFQFQAAILQRWNLPEFMCPFCPFIQTISVNVSIFTLTAIAIDRHRAIIHPLSVLTTEKISKESTIYGSDATDAYSRAKPSKYVAKLIISGIWVISIIFAVPIAVAMRVSLITEQRTFEDGKQIRYQKLFCDNEGLTTEQMRQYRYYLVFFQYMIPFGVITFIYAQMAFRLWGSKTPGNAQNSRDVSLMRNKKRVIKMLIIVVLLFGICWCPLQVYNILQVTWESVNEYRYINIVWFCSDWLAMSNSCYNPFIYGIYNDKFKREFRRRFPFFRPKDNLSEMSETNISMYTNLSTASRQSNIYSARVKESADGKGFNLPEFDSKKDKNYKVIYQPVGPKATQTQKNVLYQPICIELSTNNFTCCCHDQGNCPGKTETVSPSH